MIARRRNERFEEIRGGVSALPILTGVVVAFGTLLLLTAVVGAILVATDVLPAEGDQTARLGVPGAIALLVAQLCAYLWGGYAAGRMARGAGIVNGLMVALVALIVGLAAAGAATTLDSEVNLNVPFTAERLPIDEEVLVEWGIGYGATTLLVMFVFAAIGGMLGARWHRRLEEEHVVETEATRRRPAPVTEREADRTVDLTDEERRAEASNVSIGNRTYRT